MWISDGSTVVGHDVWNFVDTHGFSNDLAKLERGFFLVNFVSLVSSLDIVKNTEVFLCFFNLNNVHNTKWESRISSDFVVNLNQALLVLNNLNDLLASQSISQSVSQKD